MSIVSCTVKQEEKTVLSRKKILASYVVKLSVQNMLFVMIICYKIFLCFMQTVKLFLKRKFPDLRYGLSTDLVWIVLFQGSHFSPQYFSSTARDKSLRKSQRSRQMCRAPGRNHVHAWLDNVSNISVCESCCITAAVRLGTGFRAVCT